MRWQVRVAIEELSLLMDDRSQTIAKARQILTQRLESLQRAGVEQLPREFAANVAWAMPTTAPQQSVTAETPATSPTPTSCTPAPNAPPNPSPRPSVSPSFVMPRAAATTPSAPLSLSQPYPCDFPDATSARQQLLDDLNNEVRGCKLCRELACTRKQTVFGIGSAKPRVVFFGEAPGADEDRQGEPFVGRAGQLLTKIIEACGWQRSDVYIMNVLKCRPPENRNPSPSETDNCRPFFERQLEILRPEYIVCVGTVPAQALLETAESVGKLRGRFHRYRDSTVLVTYHPSYLLRNPSAKKHVWDDMQLLLKKMGLPIPGKT